MPWALIVFVGLLFVKPAASVTTAPLRAQSNVPANPQTQEQGASDKTSPQSAPASSTGQTSAPAKTPSSQTSSSQPRQSPPPANHKKKPNAVNCEAAPASATPGTSNGVPEQPQTNGSATANAPSAAPSTNCPPQKKIIPQGGTSEPSIQLAGGPEGPQASQQRATASQMLAATQLNLKKIIGRQLNSAQNDMLTQIHEFVAQSKTATAAGELERARTLAWKAQMLSEELAKPAE